MSLVTVLSLPAELAWLAGADGVAEAGVVAFEALDAGVDGLSAAEVGSLPADELGFTPAPLSGGVILTLHRQFGRR